jgi:hypothetical protein
MPLNPINGIYPGAHQPIPPEPKHKGSVATKIGSKISSFFGGSASGVKNAFSAMGKAVSRLLPRGGVGGFGLRLARKPYTQRETKAMSLEFRNSDFYKRVKENPRTFNEHTLDAAAHSILGNSRAVLAMKEHGLSLSEAVSIHIYTTEAYKEINAELRLKTVRPDTDAIVEQCKSGMAKLPSHQDLVSRLVNLPPEALADHAEGEVMTYQAFTSTSMILSGANDFHGNVFMVMQPKDPGSGGKDVSMFSRYGNEREVLFPPGAQFKILKRTEPDPSVVSRSAQRTRTR